MADLKCPYCREEHEPDVENIDEYALYRRECDSCGHTFTYTTTVICLYSERKADCLNGGEHKWEKVVSYPNLYPHRRRCEDCGLEERGEIDRELWDRIRRGE